MPIQKPLGAADAPPKSCCILAETTPAVPELRTVAPEKGACGMYVCEYMCIQKYVTETRLHLRESRKAAICELQTMSYSVRRPSMVPVPCVDRYDVYSELSRCSCLMAAMLAPDPIRLADFWTLHRKISEAWMPRSSAKSK